MDWQNSYIDFFQGVPMQIELQQIKDKKSAESMYAYMVPNSRKNGILGVEEVLIKGPFIESDFDLVQKIFEKATLKKDAIIISLSDGQKLIFQRDAVYSIEVVTCSKNKNFDNNQIDIENMTLKSRYRIPNPMRSIPHQD